MASEGGWGRGDAPGSPNATDGSARNPPGSGREASTRAELNAVASQFGPGVSISGFTAVYEGTWSTPLTPQQEQGPLASSRPFAT